MKSYSQIYALLLMFAFCTSCGQNQTDVPQENIEFEIKDIGPNIMARHIKKGSNGTILIAGPNNSSFGDVFRYDPKRTDGTSFTNLTNKIGQHKFWDVLEDRRGGLWFATTDSGVYHHDPSTERRSDTLKAGGKFIRHFTTADGLADNQVTSVYEDKAGIIWFGTGSGISRYDPSRAGGKSFQNFASPNAPLFYKEAHWNNEINTIIEDKTGKL